MSASGSVWRQLVPFFNDDQRGRLFAAVFMQTGVAVDVSKDGLAQDLLDPTSWTDNKGAELCEFVRCLRKCHDDYNNNPASNPGIVNLINNWGNPQVRDFLNHYVDRTTNTIKITAVEKVLSVKGKLDKSLADCYKLTPTSTCVRSTTGFETLKVDSIVHKRLVGLKKKATLVPTPTVSTSEELISMTDRNVWRYDGDKLYRYDPSTGNKLYYDDNDQTTKDAVSTKNKCAGTFVTKDDDECKKHVYECLLDEDPSSLAKCWIVYGKGVKSKLDFYDTAKKEIGQMHPLVALRTLQRFGFRSASQYDSEARMDLQKIESVDHWKNNYLDKKFPGDAATVKGNENLLKYLELIVQYVNANPALINKHYSGSSDESVGKFPQSRYAQTLNLHQRMEPYGPAAGINDLNRLKIHQRTGLLGATILRPPFGGPGVYAPFANAGVMPFGMPIGMMLGGYRSAQAYPTNGYGKLRNLIADSTERMSHFNKSLDDESKRKIEEKLAHMQKVERELNRTAEYVREYSDLLEAFGDYSSASLNERTLEDLVSRYQRLTDKHSSEERSMLTVLTALQKLAAGQESDELSEINGSYHEIRGRA
jgi:hypothetical protein